MRTRQDVSGGPRGFTLIELMMGVAIVGLLSSVAIPSFRNFQLRSKQAERTMMMSTIYQGIEDYFMREGKFPNDWGGGYSFLNLTQWNPDASPKAHKRAWRRAVAAGDDWNRMSMLVEGSVYYSYYGYGYQTPTYRYDLLYVLGDLDGDGAQDIMQKEWIFQNFRLLQFAGSPPDATWVWRWPNDGRAF